jgi:hypothetical protein
MKKIQTISRSVIIGFDNIIYYKISIAREDGKFVARWGDENVNWSKTEPPFQPDDSVITRIEALLNQLSIVPSREQLVEIVEVLETKEEKFERRFEPVA